MLRTPARLNGTLGDTRPLVVNVHFGFLQGCLGRVVEMHATFYAKHSGFGIQFEAKVARELAEFSTRFNPDRDGLWLAISEGQVHGSVVLDGLHAQTEGAHLRWFIVSDKARGTGVGNQLLRAALDFADGKAFSSTYLWTFDQLPAARHLYEKNGFVLAEENRASTWGVEVNEQRFVRRVA